VAINLALYWEQLRRLQMDSPRFHIAAMTKEFFRSWECRSYYIRDSLQTSRLWYIICYVHYQNHCVADTSLTTRHSTLGFMFLRPKRGGFLSQTDRGTPLTMGDSSVELWRLCYSLMFWITGLLDSWIPSINMDSTLLATSVLK